MHKIEIFKKTLPILCSYIFVGMAYGMTMEEAGYGWWTSICISAFIYTGAFQFLLVSLMSGGASLATVASSAFLMNSRQIFYSLTFLEEFRRTGRKLPYMIHTMTDETYAVNLSLPAENKEKIMFWVALLSWIYWIVGTAAGSIAGRLIPFDMEGIDFCMTALFIIIFLQQIKRTGDRTAAALGFASSIVCLILLGESRFMLPSLILSSGALLIGEPLMSVKRKKGEV